MTELSLETMEGQVRQIRQQFETLVQSHRPALWRYCRRLTGSAWEAEDLVQDTLTRAFARLRFFWQPLDARPYLFRIATNAWIDTMRKHRDLIMDADVIASSERVDATDHLDTWGAMETLVDTLSPRQRVIVLLTQVFAFTATEVGAMIGMTEGAVRATLHRARASLQADSADAQQPARPARRTAPPPSALIARYVDAFTRRDPEAVLALLDPAITHEIVGAGEEHGLDVVRRYSIADWAADPQPMWAEPGEFDGCPVVFVFYRTAETPKALTWMIKVTESAGRITALQTYVFTPELIEEAAAQMGVPAYRMGYTHQPPQPA